MRTGVLGLCSLLIFLAGSSQSQAARKDAPPVPISRAVPEYPLTALAKARDGEVIVEFIVTRTGEVRNAHAVKSSDPVFEAPAVEAVAQWVFEPVYKAGQPINTRMQVPIVFRPTDEQIAAFQGRLPAGNSPLPFARREAQTPLLPADMVPVYPYRALLENQRLLVSGEVEFDAHGRPGVPTWDETPLPEFTGAVVAMLEAWSGTTVDGQPLTGTRRLKFKFDAHDGQVHVSDAGAAILKRLRTEGENAVFATPDELDATLQPVIQPDPVFPRALRGQLKQGDAEVEFFIDPTGRVQLPHVLAASDPAFGYAACQAVASWRFTPPRQDGRPTVVRARVPVKFKLE